VLNNYLPDEKAGDDLYQRVRTGGQRLWSVTSGMG
jgi:hypothetical protein